MSRPRPSAVGQFGVATWSFEVATWGRLLGRVRPMHCAHTTWCRHLEFCTVQVTVSTTILEHCSQGFQKKKNLCTNFFKFFLCMI